MSLVMIDAYGVLGVAANAGEETIKIAFRSAAKKCHPDLNSGGLLAELRFRRLLAARDALIGRRRRSHVRAGSLQLRPPARTKAFALASGFMFATTGMAMAALLLLTNYEPPQEAAAFARRASLDRPAYSIAGVDSTAIRYADQAGITAAHRPKGTVTCQWVARTCTAGWLPSPDPVLPEVEDAPATVMVNSPNDPPGSIAATRPVPAGFNMARSYRRPRAKQHCLRSRPPKAWSHRARWVR